MKFLQEMIAKKRAAHHEDEMSEDGEGPVAMDEAAVRAEFEEFAAALAQEHAEAEGDDSFADGENAAATVSAAQQNDQTAEAYEQDATEATEEHAAEAYEADHAESYEEDDDERGLFDDESYDWEFENAETADISDAPEPQYSAASWNFEEGEGDDEVDVNTGAAMVLREIAASSKGTDAPAAAQEIPEVSTLEQNVEKLRIQRKIWDLEDGAEEAEAGMPQSVETAEPKDIEAGHGHHDEPDLDEAEYFESEGEDEPPLAASAAVSPLRVPRLEPVAEPLRLRTPAAEPATDDAPKRRAGRVKTRLLGFHMPEEVQNDPIEAAAAHSPAPTATAIEGEPQFPVGWIVVVDGPGRGASFTLQSGASKIGRGEDQAIRLDFGDMSISRDNHAALAFDDEQRCFYIGHGGKANLVRLNDMPVLSTEPLTNSDMIRIGETTLLFVALCGPEFSWDDDGEAGSSYEAAE